MKRMKLKNSIRLSESDLNDAADRKDLLNSNLSWEEICNIISKGLENPNRDILSITRVLIRIPCIFTRRKSKKSKDDHFSCDVCDLKMKKNETTNFTSAFLKRIAKLCGTILSNSKRFERFLLLQLLKNSLNHSKKVYPVLLQPFLDFEKETHDLAFKEYLYTILADILKESKSTPDNLYTSITEDRLFLINHVLTSLNSIVLKVLENPDDMLVDTIDSQDMDGEDKDQQIAALLQFTISSALPFANGVDNEMALGLIRLILKSTSLMIYNLRLSLMCQSLVKAMSESYNIESGEFLCRFSAEIAEDIVEHLFYKINGDFDPDIQSHINLFLQRIGGIDRFSTSLQFKYYFIPQMFAHILPKLHLQENAHRLLNILAKFSGEKLSGILTVSFPRFYTQIVLFNPPDVVERVVNFLINEGKVNLNVLLSKINLQPLVNELLSYLHLKRERVLSTLDQLVLWTSGTPLENLVNSNSNKKVDIIERDDFIAKRLIGLFVNIDTKMKCRIASIETKRRFLLSLIDLIILMGNTQMAQRRNRLLSSLSLFTLIGPTFYDIIYNAWNTLFKNLDQEVQLEMTVPIIYAMMPLRDKMSSEVDTSIFNILTKTGFQEAHLIRLSFLADLNDTHGTSSRIANILKTENSKDLSTFINVVIHETNNTSPYIKFLILKKLKEFIQDNNYKFHQSIKNHQSFHKTILELLRYLLEITKGNDQVLSQLSSECLGLIGAVDPRRFDYIQRAEKTNFSTFTVTSSEFKINYLVQLIKYFKESLETQNFDVYAYSIQHLMSVFELKLNSTDPVWSTLPEDYRKLIEPLAESTYDMRKQPIPDFPTPIYNSKTYGETFTKWISNWVLKLSTFVVNELPKKIFESSKMLIKRNENVATFLLPYVITYAIIGGDTDQIRSIEIEIQSIFDHWLNDEQDLSCKTYYPLKNSIGALESTQESFNRRSQLLASQVIFNLLNHLKMSVKISKQDLAFRRINKSLMSSSYKAEESKYLKSEDFEKIDNFLQLISNRKASIVALHCEDYPRSLMFIEQYLDDKPNEFQNHLNYIQNLYVSLDDLDSADGISAKRTNRATSLDELLHYTTKGKLEESTSTFERVLDDHNELTTYQTIAEIYLSIDQPNMANSFIERCLLTKPTWSQEFIDTRLEIAWRNLRFTEMKKILKETDQDKVVPSWKIHIGQIISNIYSNQFESSILDIKRARDFIISQLGASFSGIASYLRSLDYVSKLQILSEASEISNLLISLNVDSSIEREDEILENLKCILTKWKERQNVIPESIDFVDPIFQVRKTLLSLLKLHISNVPYSKVQAPINEEIQEMLLFIAKKEIKRGNFGRARFCLETGDSLSDSLKTNLYNVKVLIQRGMKEKALNSITQIVEKNKEAIHFYKDSQVLNLSSSVFQKQVGESLLLYAKLNEELKTVDYEVNLRFYHDTIKVNPSEKNYFNLASFYDRFYKESDRDHTPQKFVVKFYCKSLRHGVKYIYQSLFRALTIWFDFGAKIVDKSSENLLNPDLVSRNKILEEMTNAIRETSSQVPTQDFYAAISQLNSRICHENKAVWHVLKEIIKNIVQDWPKQTLWWLLASYNSRNNTRKSRCKQIFNELARNDKLCTIINDYKYVSGELCKLAEVSTKDGVRKSKVEILNKSFWTHLQTKTKNLNNILIPIGRNLDRPLPRSKDAISLMRLQNDVDVMPSLQKPKKLTFIGNDGKVYGIMCKSEDDLRKDYRTMEVNNVINMYLAKNEDARSRQLHIRTYAVVPLTESTGICEWVLDLCGIRPLVTSIYKQRGIIVNNKELAKIFNNDDKRLSLEFRKEKFTKVILPGLPPLLHEWFSLTFPDPNAWYTARLAFIRTSAVMSIVGYMMGLGDRHGENILIDSGTGDAVHVDFNCLFNKGEEFTYPERVPFRLTHNMVKAMGPLGYDGGFRRSCEITMSVIQNQKDLLLSVLRPFVFDPFLDSLKQKVQTGEHSSAIALEYLKRIELRIAGSARNFSKEVNIALSKEALVNYLIKESTSPENLCQMYVGWAAYL